MILERPEHSSQRADDTRERILAEARQLFAELGFASTPVRAIANAVGITDAALYYHFDNKRAILRALLLQPWEISTESIKDGRGQPLTYERLDLLVDTMLDGIVSSGPIVRLLARESLRSDPDAIAGREAAMYAWKESLLRHFSDRPAAEADRLVDSLMMLMLGVIYLAQALHGAAFSTEVEKPEFHSHVKRMVRAAVPLEQLSASCAP